MMVGETATEATLHVANARPSELHRTPLQTETAMSGQQGIAGRLGVHRAVAQDEVRQDGEYRLTPRALNAPDRETTEPNADIMGVAGQTPAAGTGRCVGELKPQGKDEGHNELDEGLTIVNQLKVSGLILEINGDRAILPCRFGCLSHVAPK